jgi:GxxExxY protein
MHSSWIFSSPDSDVLVEQRIPVYYRGHRMRDDLRIDIMVNGLIVVEIKAVDRLHPVHQAQVITYLKLTGAPVGLLVNFNATSIRAGMKRLEHPDLYAKAVCGPASAPRATPVPRSLLVSLTPVREQANDQFRGPYPSVLSATMGLTGWRVGPGCSSRRGPRS